MWLCSPIGRGSGFKPRKCEFESRHSYWFAEVAQVAEAPVSDTGCCGFESHLRQKSVREEEVNFIAGKRLKYGFLAQLAEAADSRSA